MTEKPLHIGIGAIQIHALNVAIRDDILLDEVHLEGGDLALTTGGETREKAQFTAGETQARILISEPNLNRLLAANLPPDVPVRNVRCAVLSGKVRVTAELTKFFSLPLSLEATPKVENGVRVFADWTGLNAGKITLPGPIRDVLETYLNKTFDLSTLPIPVYVDEIRCEPGRITVLGKVRLSWPSVLPQSTAHPFSPQEPAATMLEGVATKALPPSP